MVTHNSVFAAHRLQCRMTNRQNRHPAFCVWGSHAARVLVSAARRNELQIRNGKWPLPRSVLSLFLNPRNMSSGKLPMTTPLDHCVGELHDSIERFAVRCSFHARLSQNNGRVIA